MYYLSGPNVRSSSGQRVGTPAAAWIGFPVGMPVERHHEGVKHAGGLQPDSPIEVVEEIAFMAGRFPICVLRRWRGWETLPAFIYFGDENRNEN